MRLQIFILEKMHEAGSNHIYFLVISIDAVTEKDANYYLKICKYIEEKWGLDILLMIKIFLSDESSESDEASRWGSFLTLFRMMEWGAKKPPLPAFPL